MSAAAAMVRRLQVGTRRSRCAKHTSSHTAAGSTRCVLEAMESHQHIIIIERERKSSRYWRARSKRMGGAQVSCITRSMVITHRMGLLAFIMDTHCGL